MRTLFSYFLTPAGVLLLGALDASFVFFLPLGIDFVVIILAARKPELFWLYPLLAAAGSVAGAAFTFWIGHKVGTYGLASLMKKSTLRKVQARISHRGAVAVAALGIIPPPFPFTAFVLASGAGGVSPWTFLGTLGGVRLLRFATEAALGAYYGGGIIAWMESRTFTIVVVALAVLAVAGTIVSAIAVYRGIRKERANDAAVRS